MDGRLDGVPVLAPGAPSWRLTRLNARYALALQLAEVVLRNQSAEAGPGGLTLARFVVNMDTAFENFVCQALRDVLAASTGRTETPHQSHLDDEEHVPIKADVVYLIGDRAVAIFDAKYKLESTSSRYPHADLYQMLAYCTALGVATGWLVYAHGSSPPGVRHVRNSRVEIIQHALDLSATPRDLLRQVE